MKLATILVGLVFAVGGLAALASPGAVKFGAGRSADATELTAQQKKIFGFTSLFVGSAVIMAGLRSKRG